MPGGRGGAGAARALGALVTASCWGLPAAAPSEGPSWRRHGREAFVEYIVNIGCDECARLLAEDAPDPAPFSLSSQAFGCADVDVLLPSLHWVYESTRRRLGGGVPGLLVDGGANIGRATARWFAAFGDAFGRRAAQNRTQAPCIICAGAGATEGRGADGATADPPTVAVVALEPSDTNFLLLRKHAADNGWEHEGFLGLQAALGAQPGEALLAFSEDFAVDEVATLLYDEADPRARKPVRVVALNDVVDAASDAFPSLDVAALGIFLLKLDIEGLEPAVLRSLADTRAAVKFVTFEYAGNVWREGLAGVVGHLSRMGYFCFLITAERLFPVSPPFWDAAYERPVWSNFICGKELDPDLAALVQLHTGAIGLWPMLPRTYLADYAAGDQTPRSLPEAQRRCMELDAACAGVTCECPGGACSSMVLPPSMSIVVGADGGSTAAAPRQHTLGPCTVREGRGGARRSPNDEVTFLRDAGAGELFLAYRRSMEAP